MAFDQDSRRRVYALNFKPYPGLVVRCRKPSFGALTRLTAAVLLLGDDLSGEGLESQVRLTAWRKLFRAFADSLVGWNLTDHGRPVPPTRAGVLDQDLEFLLALTRTWYVLVVPHHGRMENLARKKPKRKRLRTAPSADDDRLADLPITELPAPPLPVSA